MTSTRAERKSSLVAGATRPWHSIGACTTPSGTGRRERTDRDRLAYRARPLRLRPVAYFTDATPSVGKAELEYFYGGLSGASVTLEIGRRSSITPRSICRCSGAKTRLP